MNPVALVLIVSFVVLLLLHTPIAVAIGLSSLLAVLAAGYDPIPVIATRLVSGIDSFALLAIPFFILAGLLMGRGGIARRLIDFAMALLGWLPGGLAYVNTLTCMLFGSISGSAAAAVSSVGGFMVPEMEKRGFATPFSVAVTTSAATTGLLIPPSNIMIVYAVTAGGVSIAAMFLAGVLPGILVGSAIMAVCWLINRRRAMSAEGRLSGTVVWQSFRRAIMSLLLIVIVIGGILGGVFTPTEAAAVAVAWALLLAMVLYRTVAARELVGILSQAGITTAVVFLLIGTSSGMSWVMTIANIPQQVSAALLSISDTPIVILLIINALILGVGTFMDMTPAVLIFTPILLPVVQQLGMHPVHFGIVLIANLCIGLCTPPVGTCLFIGCGIGKVSIAKVTPAMLPFYLAMILALLAITFAPVFSLLLPELFGMG